LLSSVSWKGKGFSPSGRFDYSIIKRNYRTEEAQGWNQRQVSGPQGLLGSSYPPVEFDVHYGKAELALSFLGAFAKLQKATISFRIEQLGFHWTDFY